MENYQNLVGKLLAGENLNIVQKRMDTAAFDIKTRTLYLPIWKDMTPEVNDMLICHEVSHALFTPMDYVEAIEKRLKFKNSASYLNILEDVRVEKLIKRKYQGIKKSFSVGYKQLNDLDFFGAKKKDLSKAHLMDRINLFYKVGFDCGVMFTEKEKVFVDRAGKTETIQDVIQLAEDIHKFIRDSKKEEKSPETPEPKVNPKDKAKGESSDEPEEQKNEDSSDSDEGEPSDSDETEESEEGDSSSSDDGEEESSEEEESTNGKSSDEKSEDGEDGDSEEGEESEEESSSDNGTETSNGAGRSDDDSGVSEEEGDIVTDSAFSERSKELVDYSEEREYFDIDVNKVDRVVPYKLILDAMADRCLSEREINEVKEFSSNALLTVNYLVKEFELKKAATSYKNNTVAKSGILDIKKIYAYKIKEDLFKKIAITKDGKNHGIVALLDWSGSMRYCIKDAIEQVITLVMFCKRINVPFRVFAFADGRVPTPWEKYRMSDYSSKSAISSDKASWHMMEFFSDKMNASEMKQMTQCLLTYRVQNVCALNGTPLTEALVYMYTYLNKFRKENNVEKLSLINITDGQGSRFGSFYSQGYDDSGKKFEKRYFINTPTKKVIEFIDETASQTNAVLAAIRERYDCKVIGFFLGTTSQSGDFIMSMYGREVYYEYGRSDAITKIIRTECKKNDVALLSDIPGYDMMFFVPITKLKVTNDDLVITDKANAKKIAKEFSNHLTKKKTSRIFLNKFIEIIA